VIARQEFEISRHLVTSSRGNAPDHKPVVKLFSPVGGATWLLTEINPADMDRCFGLCDLCMNEPELGYVSRAELASVRIMGGLLKLERDLFFKAEKPLSQYVDEARANGRIVA
jgi:hypothetical protein